MTDLLQTATALACIVFIVVIAAFLYRKKNRARGLVNIESYQTLGQKIGIATLAIGEELFVVAITPNEFKLLKKIDRTRNEMEEAPASPDRSSVRGNKRAGQRVTTIDSRIANKIERLRNIREAMNG